MKALTINQTAAEWSTVPAKLRELAKCVTSRLFSEKVCLTVISVGIPVGFFCVLIDKSDLGSAVMAAVMPFFTCQLAKGGEK